MKNNKWNCKETEYIRTSQVGPLKLAVQLQLFSPMHTPLFLHPGTQETKTIRQI